MAEQTPRAHEVRHLWRRHRMVVVEGPSGSGRTNTAFAAVEAEVLDGARRGMVIEGRRGPDIDDLRLWIATNVAVARVRGTQSTRSVGLVDDLHLLDDEAFSLVERLLKDEDVQWVLTTAKGRVPERIARLESMGARLLEVSTVDTSVCATILEQVWGEVPSPGMVDLSYELIAGRPGWLHKWAQASTHVAASSRTAANGEAATYRWKVFQRLVALAGPHLGLGEDVKDALLRLMLRTSTEEDHRLLLQTGEACPHAVEDRLVVTVPALRRLVNMRDEDAQPARRLEIDQENRAKGWLGMMMPLGALDALAGQDGATARLLRAEAFCLLGRHAEAAELVPGLVDGAAELEQSDLPRLVAVCLATSRRADLSRLTRHPDIAAILRGIDLARAEQLQEAASAVDVGVGTNTEPTAPGLAPLRRALAAWFHVLADDTVGAYKLMFGAPPSSHASGHHVSALFESLLGDLHAVTALALGEFNRVGITPEAYPHRANTWLRHDFGAWTCVATIMGVNLGGTPLVRSVFAQSIHGLGWLHTLARTLAEDGEATSTRVLAGVRKPQEPGLVRLLGVCRSRAEIHAGQGVVPGTDAEEKAAVAAGSTLARVQMALWGSSAKSSAERSTARASLERLASVYGFDSWLSIPNEVSLSVSGLSRREKEVCMELALGYTAGETAHRLGISPRTVEKHAANAYRKLDITSRTELAGALGLASSGARR